ncbi:putative electron transfer flavoprotein subunit [Linnemannia zychae]|nr:putative electron transfer flavoprotein subunit [Linnemannia zychae]
MSFAEAAASTADKESLIAPISPTTHGTQDQLRSASSTPSTHSPASANSASSSSSFSSSQRPAPTTSSSPDVKSPAVHQSSASQPPSTSATIEESYYGSIPTSNALSSSLKSRISSSASLSSLSSVTPTGIISPKPYTAYDHSTAAASSASLSAATSSLLMLSGSKGHHSDMNSHTPINVHVKSEDLESTRARPSSLDNSNTNHNTSSHNQPDWHQSQSQYYDQQQQQQHNSRNQWWQSNRGSEDEEMDQNNSDQRRRHERENFDSQSHRNHPYHNSRHLSSHYQQQQREREDTDEDMTDMSAGAGSKIPTARKRLASPSSPQSASRRETSTPIENSMTPSPSLPPRASGSPGASVSPRTRKNSVSGAKKEQKVGVTATSCANCGTTTTPLWRRAGNGQTICNACGLYFKARNLTRPTWLKRNTGGKKNDANSEDPDEVDGRGGAKNSGAGSGNPSATSDATEEGGEKAAAPGMPGHVHDSECAGTCPGDGNCNGAGGAESCAGCPSFNQHQANRQHLVCANCRTTTTPLWRRDSSGNTICNACGLYFKLHNVHRPVTMKRAVIKRRKRVNLLASSPPPPAAAPEQEAQSPTQAQDAQQQPASQQQRSPQKTKQQKMTTSEASVAPTASDLEPSDNNTQEQKQSRGIAKRRKIHNSIAPRGVPAIEDYILPKRSANGQVEWMRQESGTSDTHRSVSPIENIGNERTQDDRNHHYSHSSSYDQAPPSSHSQDQNGANRDHHHHLQQQQQSSPSSSSPGHSQSSSRYLYNVHQGNGQYQTSQSMTMSRYPMHSLPPPPPPRNLRQSPPHSAQSPHHSQHLPPPQHHYHHERHHPDDITMQGYQGLHGPRSGHMDDSMHSSQYPAPSSGWNHRLPGYATVSSNTFSTRLSSIGIVHSSGPSPNSPPGYPRQETTSPYAHSQSMRSQGHDSYGSCNSPSGSLGGRSDGRSGYSSSYNHYGLPSILSPIRGNAREDDNDCGVEGAAHLPPISIPSSSSQHQPLPRASEILQHRQENSHHSHHVSYSQPQQPQQQSQQQRSSPPPTSSSSATSAVLASINAGGIPNAEVLQQTREDLQREVSHLSMLLGRAAAVLNGLDQALGTNKNGSEGAGADGKSNSIAAMAALGAGLTTDLKTSSALASLMALSASGDKGASNGNNSGSDSPANISGSGSAPGGATGSSTSSSPPSTREPYNHTNASIPPPPPLSSRHTHMSYPLPRRE